MRSVGVSGICVGMRVDVAFDIGDGVEVGSKPSASMARDVITQKTQTAIKMMPIKMRKGGFFLAVGVRVIVYLVFQETMWQR